MKKIIFIITICLPVIAGAQDYRAISQKTDTTKTSVATTNEIQFAKERIMRLRAASLDLLTLAKEPIPSNLNVQQTQEAQKYSRWLMDSGTDLVALADRWESTLLTTIRDKSSALMIQKMNYSFNIQYLSLQQKLQQETREFNLISNIMKVKHEAAKNAINNIR